MYHTARTFSLWSNDSLTAMNIVYWFSNDSFYYIKTYYSHIMTCASHSEVSVMKRSEEIYSTIFIYRIYVKESIKWNGNLESTT